MRAALKTLTVPRCKCGAQILADGIEALDVFAGSVRGPLIETHGRSCCTLTVGKHPEGWPPVLVAWHCNELPASFTPIYRAYAADHEKTPEQMIRADRDAYPGGSMAGFIAWVAQQREKGLIV